METQEGDVLQNLQTIVGCGGVTWLGKNALVLHPPNGPHWVFHPATNLDNLQPHNAND